MEGMRRGWGRQPGPGQAGSEAPSQPEQEVLREHRSLSLGTRRAPSSLCPPSSLGWGEVETLGASPTLPEEELRERKATGKVLLMFST